MERSGRNPEGGVRLRSSTLNLSRRAGHQEVMRAGSGGGFEHWLCPAVLQAEPAGGLPCITTTKTHPPSHPRLAFQANHNIGDSVNRVPGGGGGGGMRL